MKFLIKCSERNSELKFELILNEIFHQMFREEFWTEIWIDLEWNFSSIVQILNLKKTWWLDHWLKLSIKFLTRFLIRVEFSGVLNSEFDFQ